MPIELPEPGPVFMCTDPCCRHHYVQHEPDGPCRVRVAKDWDGKEFLTEEHCGCARYQGLTPDAAGCPHEWVKDSPNCVHCGTVRSSRR